MKESNPNLLHESEILEQITDAFISLDKDWHYTYLNSKAAAILNKTKEELIGKNIWELFPESVGLPFHKAYLEAMKTQKYTHLEEHYPPLNLWFENHIYPTPNGLTVVIRDVSEKKLQELALQESEAQYRFFIEVSNDLIQSVAPDGSFLFVNTTWEKTLGYSKSEWASLNLFNIIHPDYKEKCGLLFHRILQGESVLNFEVEFLKKDGSFVILEGNASPRIVDGKVLATQSFLRDITERRKGELLLSEKQHLLEASQRIAGIGNWIFWLKDDKMVWDAKTFEIYEQNPEQFIPDRDSFLNLIYPDDHSKMFNWIQECLKGNKPGDFEFRIVAPNGTIKFLNGSGELFYDKNGQPTHVIGTAQDITERKKNEEKIIESERKLQSKLDKMIEGVIMVDFDLKYIYLNDHAEIVSQYPKRELIGYKMTEKYLGVEQTEVYKALEKCLKEREPQGLETEFTFPDGQAKWFQVSIQPIEEGAFILYFEITARKNEEEKLAESQSRYRMLFEHMTEAVAYHQLVFENGLATDYIYLDVNDAFEKHTGFGTVIGKKVSELVTDIHKTNPDLLKRFARVAQSGESEKFESYIKSTNSWYFTSLYALSIDKVVSVFSNITERKIAEEELLKSEARFHTAFENASSGICLTALDGKFFQVNKAMCKMLGFNVKELVGKTFHEITYPEDIELSNEIVKKTITTKSETLNFNERYIRKNGEIIWANISSTLLKDEKQNPLYFITHIIDITQQKKAEEKIIYQASLLANVNDAVISSDENFILTSWNRSAERIYGWKAEEVIGKLGGDILQTEFITLSRPEAIKQLKEDGRYYGEVLNKTKDNQAIFIETRTTALRDAKGIITGYVSINRDITNRKKAEERLRQSEEDYKKIVETAQEGIWVIDKNNKTTFVNKKSCEILEYSSEELLNKSFLELLDEEEKIKALSHLEAQLENPDSRNEYKVFTKSGRQIWVMVASSPILDSENNYVGSLGMLSEITERKKAEEEIIHMNKQLRNLTSRLQSIREEERTEMAHDIHDVLGQQLTMVKMHLHTLMKKNENKTSEFTSQAELMATAINETVDTVRKLASDLHPIVLDDQGLVEALQWQSNEFSKSSKIECIFTSIGNEVPSDVALNTQIFRIYQESLTNVARHAKATQVKATLKLENGLLKLMITDNGIGFKKEEISGKKSLGLVMMRERAIGIGGEISIITEPLQGTSILLTLPISN